MKYICWNHESGFSVIDAKEEDKAKLQCELNEPAFLMGEENDVRQNIIVLLGLLSKKSVIVDEKQLEKQIRYAEVKKVGYENPENMDTAESYGYWEGRLDALNEIKTIEKAKI